MWRQMRSIREVVDWGMCVGCGACFYACPHDAVELIDVPSIGIRPRINHELCAACEKTEDCLAICPGRAVEAPPPSGKIERELGTTLELWEGWAVDPETRRKASSGGILSALALYCLEREGMEFALHAGADPDKPWLNKTVRSRTREEILARTGSRYAPASPCEGLSDIAKSESPCVFIGKPCDAAGAARACERNAELRGKLGLLLSFCCAGTPSTQGTLELLRSLDVKPEEVRDLRYRGEGWPGGFKVSCGRRPPPFIDYPEAWSSLTKHRPYRCNLCPDGLGRLADISCGDAWHHYRKDAADDGRSIVFVRTERGREILHRALAAGYLELHPLPVAEALAAQTSLLTRRRALFGRLLALKLLGAATPDYRGFGLLASWLRLSPVKQARSLFGTLRRALQRGWRRPQPIDWNAAIEAERDKND
jgi:coenzyme F420 hydrogenase subunit beta